VHGAPTPRHEGLGIAAAYAALLFADAPWHGGMSQQRGGMSQQRGGMSQRRAFDARAAERSLPQLGKRKQFEVVCRVRCCMRRRRAMPCCWQCSNRQARLNLWHEYIASDSAPKKCASMTRIPLLFVDTRIRYDE
jgi:hypothetical protein